VKTDELEHLLELRASRLTGEPDDALERTLRRSRQRRRHRWFVILPMVALAAVVGTAVIVDAARTSDDGVRVSEPTADGHQRTTFESCDQLTSSLEALEWSIHPSTTKVGALVEGELQVSNATPDAVTLLVGAAGAGLLDSNGAAVEGTRVTQTTQLLRIELTEGDTSSMKFAASGEPSQPGEYRLILQMPVQTVNGNSTASGDCRVRIETPLQVT
jgi:hypothetical protein